MMASTADTNMYMTTVLKYHIKNNMAAVAASPTMNRSMFCGVSVMPLRYLRCAMASTRYFLRRTMGVCDPTTGSPISTSSSLSFGTSTSMREPNLMNPHTEFCSTVCPTFM